MSWAGSCQSLPIFAVAAVERRKDLKVTLLGSSGSGVAWLTHRLLGLEAPAESVAVETYGFRTVTRNHGISTRLSFNRVSSRDLNDKDSRPKRHFAVGAIVIVYDASKPALSDVEEWHQTCAGWLSVAKPDPIPKIFVVGNKIDEVGSRTEHAEEGKMLASSLGADFFECSAKTGEGVDDVLNALVETRLARLGLAEESRKPYL